MVDEHYIESESPAESLAKSLKHDFDQSESEQVFINRVLEKSRIPIHLCQALWLLLDDLNYVEKYNR